MVAQYQSLDIADFSGTVRRYNIAESEFAAISISFTLQVTLLSANIIETVKNTTSDALTAGSYVTSDDDIVVIVFQPNCKILKYYPESLCIVYM